MDHPPEEPVTPPFPAPQPPRHPALGILWAFGFGLAGVLVCSVMIVKFGELGTFALWGMGSLGGYVSRRITGGAKPLCGWILAAMCIAALLAGEVSWIRFHTVKGQDGWMESVAALPLFVREYQWAAAIGALMCGFGAFAAFTRP